MIKGRTFKEILESVTPHDAYTLEERAAIMEYDGGLGREEAEELAYYAIFSQLELFM